MKKKATKLAQKETGFPCAWICSKNDRGRKPIKNGKIYLKNNEQFELELYNPTSDKMLAIVYVNGLNIARNGILMESNERLYLDSYIDSTDKESFVYKHYLSDISELEQTPNVTQYIQVFFHKEIGDIMELLEKLKDDREKETNDEKDFKKFLEILKSGTKKYPPYTNPNINQPVWIDPNWQQTPWIQTPYYYGGLSSGTTNAINSLNLNTTTNISSISNNNMYSSLSNTSNDIQTINGKIEFIKNDNISNEDNVIIDKEMEFEDDHLSMIMYEILPDLVKPITSKDINTNKKEKDKIQKLLDLKSLLDSELITKDEFDNLKKEIL